MDFITKMATQIKVGDVLGDGRVVKAFHHEPIRKGRGRKVAMGGYVLITTTDDAIQRYGEESPVTITR